MKSFGLFVGDDITAHLIASSVTFLLASEGLQPCIFYTATRAARRHPPELVSLYNTERAIWPEVIFPALSGCETEGSQFLTPRALANRWSVSQIEDVNSDTFIDHLAQEGIVAALSIRCYQKFGDQLLSYFEQRSEQAKDASVAKRDTWETYNFVNLHPGSLPRYRGVFTIAHAMIAGEKVAGLSLHKIEKDWDSGPILFSEQVSIDYTRSSLDNLVSQVPVAIELVSRYLRSTELHPRTQDRSQAQYFSHLCEKDIRLFERRGLRLSNGCTTAREICQRYFGYVPEILMSGEERLFEQH